MPHRIGLRREDMYAWERRTPLIPEHAGKLQQHHGIEIVVQSSDKRAYTDDEYRAAGLQVVERLSDCSVIVGLKEVSIGALEPGKTYIFFSHTIKGQPANMPMLKRCLDLECTVIDYERIVDENNRRLIFFGNYAGLAGMIDTLWTLGRRLAWEGIDSPLSALKQASAYPDLEAAKRAIRDVGHRMTTEGLPPEISPLVVGITGYGNVSKGAQEILNLLPIERIDAADLLSERPLPAGDVICVVFREGDTVERIDGSKPFDLQEYYDHPERYRAAFSRYLPHLHVLVNCIYWEPRYPKLATRDDLRALYEGEPRLRVIGDITCDVDGAIEATIRATESDDPVYVYDPVEHRATSGVAGRGPVVMAVEILPSELPRESSAYFSGILKGFLPAIAAADLEAELAESGLPPELQRATIVHRGRLTPDYRYLTKHLP